jgi:hypothetical protein
MIGRWHPVKIVEADGVSKRKKSSIRKPAVAFLGSIDDMQQ